MTEVAEGIHRFGSNYINWYLMEQGGRVTILDCGLPGYVGDLGPALAEIGRTVDDVDAILLTHYHIDHVGAAEPWRQLTGAKVIAHRADAPYITGKVPGHPPELPMTRPYFLRYLDHLLPNGAAGPYPAVAALTEFDDGDVLDVPGRPRVVHAPGHTPGCCALYLETAGVLFSGDVLVTLNTGDGSTGPRVLSRFFQGDAEQALQAIETLRPLKADILLPGHGDPWHGGVARAVEIARRNGIPG